ASSRVNTSAQYRKSATAANCAAGISANNRHNGLPANRATTSHAAFNTAANDRCTTPFSGPNQRNCESAVNPRYTAPISANIVATPHPTTNTACCPAAATTNSLPRPTVNDNPKPQTDRSPAAN